MKRARIFGLGTQKTGNTSIQAALSRLGLRCRQWHHRVRALGYNYLMYDDPAVIEAGTRNVNAWVDYPILFYEQLPDICPDAIYIHNVRDTGLWLRSIGHQFVTHYFEVPKIRRVLMAAYYGKLFGKPWPTPDEAAKSKRQTDAAISRWLVDRPHLTINVMREPDWHLKLARFVGREWPGGPAPRKRQTDYLTVDCSLLRGSPIESWSDIIAS